MKHSFLFLIILIPTLCFSQWSGIYFHADQESVIKVLNKDTIIAATYGGGRIHRSTDGGKTWSSYQTIFSTSWFNDLDFPTNSVGYACGGTAFGNHRNFIAKTIDGGQTWDSITANDFPGYSFKKIHFLNADTGFVTNETKDMLITVDGGNSFNSILTQGNVTDIVSKPNKEVIISLKEYITTNTYAYSIAKSTDLGTTWNTTYSDTLIGANANNRRKINSIFFVDNNTGYAVGASGLFLKTSNGGDSWTNSFINPFSELTGLYFVSQKVGYINNAGGIYRTDDAGISWTVQKMNPLTIIRQIEFANDTIGYALGDQGIFKTMNGGVILRLNEINEASNIEIYPNPAKNMLHLQGLDKFSVNSIQLFDIRGKLMQTFSPNKVKLILTDIPKGVYIIQIKTNRQQISKKLIVN